MDSDVIGLNGAKLDLLCKKLRNLSALLDSNDDESNANVCKQAANAIWNLYACVGVANSRLCTWCGVCHSGKRDPWGCEIAQLENGQVAEDIPMEYLEAGGTL